MIWDQYSREFEITEVLSTKYCYNNLHAIVHVRFDIFCQNLLASNNWKWDSKQYDLEKKRIYFFVQFSIYSLHLIVKSQLQTASGVSSFSDVKSAVDAVVEILQSGIPMARIGRLIVMI